MYVAWVLGAGWRSLSNSRFESWKQHLSCTYHIVEKWLSWIYSIFLFHAFVSLLILQQFVTFKLEKGICCGLQFVFICSLCKLDILDHLHTLQARIFFQFNSHRNTHLGLISSVTKLTALWRVVLSVFKFLLFFLPEITCLNIVGLKITFSGTYSINLRLGEKSLYTKLKSIFGIALCSHCSWADKTKTMHHR